MKIIIATYVFTFFIRTSLIFCASVNEQERNLGLINIIQNGSIEEILRYCASCENQEEMVHRAKLMCTSQGNVDVLQGLLASEITPDINIKDYDGATLLHDACDNGQELLLKTLLNYEEINVNARDNNGQTCIYYCATNYHDLDCLRLLLQDGRLDVNIVDNDGKSVLHKAVEENALEAMEEIINDGRIEVDLQEKYGATALHFAVIHDTIDIASLLIQKGVSLTATDIYGRTAKDL